MTAFMSGSITCAAAFGSIFMKSIVARVLGRFGFRRTLLANAAFSGLALAVYGLFCPGMPHALIWAVVLLGGFFPSLQFSSLNALAYADIATPDVGRATSVASVIQQVSLGLGVTIAGLVLALSHHVQGHASIVWTDFWPAFLVTGLFCVASIPVSWRLPEGAGAEIARGRK